MQSLQARRSAARPRCLPLSGPVWPCGSVARLSGGLRSARLPWKLVKPRPSRRRSQRRSLSTRLTRSVGGMTSISRAKARYSYFASSVPPPCNRMSRNSSRRRQPRESPPRAGAGTPASIRRCITLCAASGLSLPALTKRSMITEARANSSSLGAVPCRRSRWDAAGVDVEAGAGTSD